MQKTEALAVAQKYLAKQERTEGALFQELIQKGCGSELAQAVLEESVQNGWVCDARFCLRYCERNLCKGYGPIKITEELRDKKLPTSAIIKAVSEVDFSTWEHAAMLALEKKFGRDYRSAPRPKVIQFLEQRGFSDEYMLFLIKDQDE